MVALAAVSVLPLRAQEAASAITLEEAVRLAVRNDPAAVAAEAGITSARADLLQAKGAFTPSLTVNSAYSNSSNSRFDQTSGQLVSESYTAQVQTGYDLFTGGRRFTALRAANADAAAAEARYISQRYATVLRATESFYAAAAARDIVDAANQRLARAKAQLEAANTRLELGTATQSDALRAQLEVGNAELAVLDAESSLNTAALELGRIIGTGGAVATAAEALPASAPALPGTSALIAEAAASSPIVQTADAVLRSRRADRLGAYTPYLPSLRLTGGYDWTNFEFPPRTRSWVMRLTASLPVLNGFAREAAVQRASADERVAEAQAKDARIGARVAVESAVAEIASAERRVQIADRAVQLAREDLRVQEERYSMNAATILDLQTSQVALSDAEVAAVRARQTLGTAVARLEAILGRPLNQE
ncbi:MAG TPA: TolC family protein [Longimicrobiales bacterium]